jgi:aspartate ammonia-lyase
MSFSEHRIHDIAGAIGIPPEDLVALFSRGHSRTYQAGDYLFHESTPRLWMGIVEEGEIEIVAGLHGSTTRLATLTRGTAFGEGVMLDDLPHAGSAVALT